MLSVLVLCWQLHTSQAAEGGEAQKLKTGTYRICYGEVEECRQGKGTLGGDYLDFEKNGTGRYTFKYEETGFLWNQTGDVLNITEDDAEYTMKVLDGSKMLMNLKESEQVPYVLVEAEDTAFRPGVYFQCDKAALEKGDAAAIEAFSDYIMNDVSDVSLYTVLTLYTDWSDYKEPSTFWAKGSKDATTVTWEQKETTVDVTFPGPKKKTMVLTIDRNRLFDKATGDVYLRAFSERVARSAN